MADWTVRLNDKTIKSFSISEGETISIGRGKECDVSIDNTAISRRHVSLALNGGIYFVSDLGSTNGTFVNGKKIGVDELVSETDDILFGKFHLCQAAESDYASELSSSVSADLMDMEDEKIFVTGKQKSAAKKQFAPKGKGPHLKVLQGNGSPKDLSLAGKNSVKIGKDPSCDMVITGWFVAKAQCYIIKREKDYCLVPQKSWAGTFINNEKASGEHPLRSGDIIKIRHTTIRFD